MLVRNLPFQAEVPDVRSFCEGFGDVEDVYLPRDYYSKRPKGIAFVQFSSGDACAAAVKGLDGQDFLGKRVQCVVAEHGRKRVVGRQGFRPGQPQGAGAEPGDQRGRRERRRGGERSEVRPRPRSRSRSRSRSPDGRFRRSRSRSVTPAGDAFMAPGAPDGGEQAAT